jgi:hypothetical protein
MTEISLETINPILSIDILSNITFALIVLLAGFTIGRLLGIAIYKILKTIEFDKSIKKISKNSNASKKISNLITWIIYIMSVIIALMLLNALYYAFLIIIYFLGILVLGTILFGITFSIPNFIEGFRARKKIKKGQIIKINNITGKIIRVGLLNTKIAKNKDEIYVVPNKLFKKRIKIESQANS